MIKRQALFTSTANLGDGVLGGVFQLVLSALGAANEGRHAIKLGVSFQSRDRGSGALIEQSEVDRSLKARVRIRAF